MKNRRKKETMKTYPDRESSLALLKKYNTDPFHIQHALTLSEVMRRFAEDLGYEEDKEFWATVGLLHDVDFGTYPEEHLQWAPKLLAEVNASDEFVRAVLSHGYGICSDVEPVHEMEKVLFAVDELTGLIASSALVRPSKSCKDMELKSLKKKFKTRSFAAGCDRDIIQKGADRLGWTLDELMQRTLDVMKETEDRIAEQLQEVL